MKEKKKNKSLLSSNGELISSDRRRAGSSEFQVSARKKPLLKKKKKKRKKKRAGIHLNLQSAQLNILRLYLVKCLLRGLVNVDVHEKLPLPTRLRPIFLFSSSFFFYLFSPASFFFPRAHARTHTYTRAYTDDRRLKPRTIADFQPEHSNFYS